MSELAQKAYARGWLNGRVDLMREIVHRLRSARKLSEAEADDLLRSVGACEREASIDEILSRS